MWLVTERNDVLVGYVQGSIDRPSENHQWQLKADVAESVLRINALFVVEDGNDQADKGGSHPQIECHERGHDH